MVRNAARDGTPSGKQVVFFFMAATLVVVVVFLCGVLVGRGVPRGVVVSSRPIGERFSVPDLPPATRTTPSSRPSAGASASADLSYPTRLTGRALTTELIDTSAVGRATALVDVERTARTSMASHRAESDAFAVQVSASRGHLAAQAIAHELRVSGYPAYVLDPFPDDPVPFHRVRVGPYETRAEAEHARDRLVVDEHIAAAYITR